MQCPCGTAIHLPHPAFKNSIFGEVSDADVSRIKAPTANPFAPQVVQRTNQLPPGYEKAYYGDDYVPGGGMKKGAAAGAVQAAATALMIPSFLSLLACIVIAVCMFMLELDPAGFVFAIVFLCIHGFIMLSGFGAGFMLQSRAPGARIVGFIAAGIFVLSGGPIHIGCGIWAMVKLASAEAGAALSS